MVPLKYNVRSLFVRRGTTLMTIGSIAFVVLVYIGVLGLVGGLRAAFSASGDRSTIIVLRDGTQSESTSYYPSETHRLLAALPGVARGQEGQPLASGETVTLQILKRRDGTETNVTLRGVEPSAFVLHSQIRLVEGRRFEPGKGEVIVGKRLASRFVDLSLGSEVPFGRLRFRVVGIFEAQGAIYSSEIWGAVQDFGNAFRRTNYYSSTRLKAGSPDQRGELTAAIEGDQRLRVSAMPETEYYERQTAASTARFVFLGNLLAVMMGFGACFAAANTMYAQVAARAREIGTLRALGFRRRTILGAFLSEAAVLGLIAGLLGALLALPLNGLSAGTTNFLSFSEITFVLRTTPGSLAVGILLAVLTGILGGFPPAWSAARRPITELLREA